MKNLDLLSVLYREDEREPEGLIGDDEALRDEFDVLRDTKAVLDARPGERPDPDRIDAVLRLAAAATDRSAVPRRRSLGLVLLRPVALAAAACMIGLAGYWIGWRSASSADMDVNTRMSSGVVMEQEAMSEDGLVLQEKSSAEADASLFAARERSLPAPAAPTAEASEAFADAAEPAALPVWDEQEDLLIIQWRVEELEEALSGVDWDQAVPLGAMQSGAPAGYPGAASFDSARGRLEH